MPVAAAGHVAQRPGLSTIEPQRHFIRGEVRKGATLGEVRPRGEASVTLQEDSNQPATGS